MMDLAGGVGAQTKQSCAHYIFFYTSRCASQQNLSTWLVQNGDIEPTKQTVGDSV